MNGDSANRLLAFIERVERLEVEKRALADDIKEIYAEAKSAGFDTKVMRQMVRERAMVATDREEMLALAEIYRAALGMLDGTPLGEAARRRLMGKRPAAPTPPAAGATAPAPDMGEAAPSPDDPAPPKPPAAPPTAEEILTAKAEGAAAAKAGRAVVANPYPAGDPRRGAWDEGWCAASGSDGMDIPPAWRRSAKKRDGKPGGAGA